MITPCSAWDRRQIVRCCWLAVLTMSMLLGGLFLVAASHSESASEPSLRVMTYNVSGISTQERLTLAVMRPYRPDLVLLQKARNTDHVTRLGQTLELPYWRFAPYARDRGGVAILSRWPLGPAQVLPWPHSPKGRLALAAQVEHPMGRFWVCSVHLDNPLTLHEVLTPWQKALLLWREFLMTTPRLQAAQALSTWLFQLGSVETIIGGDFNSMPLAGADRHLRQYFKDALALRPSLYFTGTYWGPLESPIRPRIDFVYYSSHWQVVDAQVIQQKASDHFPVLVVLSPLAKAPESLTPQRHKTTLADIVLRWL